MPSRIRYFDIAKGIAMLCVVLGHSILITNAFTPVGTGQLTILNVCFTFHMPLFFILSGYFMKVPGKFSWEKESRELLATYAITATATIVVNTILAFILRTGTKATFAGWAAAAFYGAGDLATNYLWPVPYRIGAIWFLLALFWAHLFVYWISRRKHPLLWVVLFFLVGYFSAKIFWLPLSIQSGMTATVFLYFGIEARRHRLLDAFRQRPYLWILTAAIWIIFIWKFTGFSMAMNNYGVYPILDLFGSLCACLCIMGIAMLCDKWLDMISRGLALIGRHTLAILCVHLFEDNLIPWAVVLPWLSAVTHEHMTGLVLFVVRFAIDCLLVWGLYHVPKVNEVFFPILRKRQLKV